MTSRKPISAEEFRRKRELRHETAGRIEKGTRKYHKKEQEK